MNTFHNTRVHQQAQQLRRQEICRLLNAGLIALNNFLQGIRQPQLQQQGRRGNVIRSTSRISAA